MVQLSARSSPTEVLLQKYVLKIYSKLTGKMSATMVDRLQKNLKKHWQKRPKAVPQKMKIGPKHK